MTISSSLDLHVRLQSIKSEKTANTGRGAVKGNKFLLAYL